MVELTIEQKIELLNGNLDIIQKTFQTDSSKYLFKNNSDKFKFEIKQLRIIKKELKQKNDDLKDKIIYNKQIMKKISLRLKELKEMMKDD